MKMENPTHIFREANLVLQLIKELQIKSKTLMSWSSWKKNKGIFCTEVNFFKIYALSQCIVYWMQFQNIHTFTYQKNITSYTFVKLSKAFSVSLTDTISYDLQPSEPTTAFSFAIVKAVKVVIYDSKILLLLNFRLVLLNFLKRK